jgi:hypothetical protein
MTDNDLAHDEDFWLVVLGKNYDSIPEKNKNLEDLAEKFFWKHNDLIRDKYGSKDNFVDEVTSVEEEDARNIIRTFWTEKKWERKSSGTDYQVQGGFEEVAQKLKSEDIFHEDLNDGFNIVWPSVSRTRTLAGEESVRGALQQEVYPLIVRENEDESFELRGGKQRRRKFANNVLEEAGAEEVEPEISTESIIENLQKLFERDIGSLKLIGIKFNDSYLPSGASLTVENDEGILEDFQSAKLRGSIVDVNTLAALDYIQFDYRRTDNKVKIKVDRTDEGFQFEIRDSHLSEDDKDKIRSVIAEYLGVEFDKIYRYDAQHDEKEIFHRIMSGNVDLFEKFSGELSSEANELLDQFIEMKKKSSFRCYRCQEEYEEEPESCEECENDTFNEKIQKKLNINEEEIEEAVKERIESIPDKEFTNGDRSLSNPKFSEEEMGSKEYVRAVFSLTDSGSNGNILNERYEYFFHALGNGRIPQKANKYLLNMVLVVYGENYFKNRDFGQIGLYDFLTKNEEETGREITEAVVESKRLFRDRVWDAKKDSEDKLEHLLSLDLSEDNEEFFDDYSGKDFEQDVFNILKFVFTHTERWGKEGNSETDGAIILRRENGGYSVFSYDPKRNSGGGYDLNSDEKNKAAYYLLSENQNQKIEDLTNSGISGHIFISNKFKEGQFEHVENKKEEWAEMMKEHNEKPNLNITFMKLEALMDLFKLIDEYYDQIRANTELKNRLNEKFIEEIRSGESYTEFDQNSTEEIRNEVINVVDKDIKNGKIKDMS